MILDAQSLDSQNQRNNTAYVIGCDRYNLGQKMGEFEQGVNRGFNQLSTEVELYKAVPVGPGNCIYRIDLDAIGWTREDWEFLASNDILGFQTNTIRGKNLQFLLQKKHPYVYASSALITATEADAVANRNGKVYYRLVKQDVDTTKFLAQQAVDRQRQVNNEEPSYAAFSRSQIALGKSRMVSVFRSRFGSCVGTHDTVLGGDDVFSNSFPIELARANQINGNLLTAKIFNHNAQEWICSLPNKLWGLYRLNNAQDLAEAAAPNNVVNQPDARIDPTIRIGQCSLCHFKEGVAIPFRDQLRAHISGNTAYNEKEKRLGDVFFRFDNMTASLEQINREHTRAMEELGITASQDPLNNVVMNPLREEMNIDQVASLLWMDTETFRRRLAGSAQSGQVFGNLLNEGGTVSLAILSNGFDNLVRETRAYEDDDL